MLKNGCALGSERVYAELIKNGTDKLFDVLTEVFTRHVLDESMPQVGNTAGSHVSIKKA